MVAGGGHEDVHVFDRIFQTDHAVALHGALLSTDRIHCRDADGGAEASQGLGRTLPTSPQRSTADLPQG